MSSSFSSEHPSQGDLLQRACARRLGAEIELQTPEGDRHFGRMRLIALDEQQVYIDRPVDHGIPLELTAGTPAVVYFVLEKQRWSFHSVVGEACRVPIGDGHCVPGFALPAPHQISRDERRHDLRVALGHATEIICQVRALQGDTAVTARVMDISAGGIAAVALELNGVALHRGADYVVEFEVPKISRRFIFHTRLCHVRHLKNAGCIIGLKYVADGNVAETRHAIRQLSQFVARQLSKRRAEPAWSSTSPAEEDVS